MGKVMKGRKGRKGMISAGHELTCQSAVEVFKAGGNAFDAALAAVFSSFVCESALTGAGGGGYAMISTKNGETFIYDFSAVVPGLGLKGGITDEVIEGLDFRAIDIDFTDTIQTFHGGRGSVAVPGALMGLNEIYKNHCTMPLHDLMSKSIGLAKNGVTLNSRQAYINSILKPITDLSDESRDVYSPRGPDPEGPDPGGGVLLKGDVIKNELLAATFEELSTNGLDSFYKGDFADKLVSDFGIDSGGLITKEDLENYRVIRRDPLRVKYRDSCVHLNPPPSTGGAMIALILGILNHFDLSEMGHNRYATLRAYYEAFSASIKLKPLVSDDGFLADLMSGVHSEKYKDNLKKLLGTSAPVLDSSATSGSAGNTTHISVYDDEGNAVSITMSNGESSGYMVNGTGLMLNNMLGEEDINPHGFFKQSPGSRLHSMMSPCIVKDEADNVRLILGSGGSNRITSAIAQTIANSLDFKMNIEDAVNSDRVHFDGEVFQVEPNVDDLELVKLEDEGIKLNKWLAEGNMYFGGVHTIEVSENGLLAGAGDKRRGGVVMEFDE